MAERRELCGHNDDGNTTGIGTVAKSVELKDGTMKLLIVGFFSVLELLAQPSSQAEATRSASVSGSRLNDAEIADAIALGMRYKDPNKLWSREFHKTNAFRMRGFSWAASIRILTDRAMIAIGASVAAHELRQFSVADARSLPDLGKLKVLLTSTDTGYYHNATRDLHMVLRIGDQTLQPQSKNETKTSIDYSHLAGIPNDEHASLSFIFEVPDHATDGQFVVIGANSKEHVLAVEFSGLR